MLNLNAIRTATMQEVPYRWAKLENLLPKTASSELANSYPRERYAESMGEGYRFLWRPLIAIGENRSKLQQLNEVWCQRLLDGSVTSDLQDLSDVWRRLIEELHKPAYTEAMEELSGFKLRDYAMVIGFRRYPPGHCQLPHTDHPSKVLTHLFFFNEEWPAQWGGYFRILKDEQPESVFQDILPLSQTSLVLVRSVDSWHQVTPVATQATQSRLAVQVAFFSDAGWDNGSPVTAERQKSSTS